VLQSDARGPCGEFHSMVVQSFLLKNKVGTLNSLGQQSKSLGVCSAVGFIPQ